MDVNGLPFRQLAGRADFGLAPDSSGTHIAEGLAYADNKGLLHLARQQAAPELDERENFARRMVTMPGPVADPYGGFAWWDSDEKQIRASGFAVGAIEIKLGAQPVAGAPPPPPPSAPTSMALGEDILYVARDGEVIFHDLRTRWPDTTARHPGFRPDLLAPAPDGGAWAFDQGRRILARVTGKPLRFTGLVDPDPAAFVPVDPNRNPPRILPVNSAPIPANFAIVALATSPEGQIALLGWEDGEEAMLFTFEVAGFVARFRLAGLRFPYSIAWTSETDIAVMASDDTKPAAQAFVYAMDSAPTPDRSIPPDGRIHPLIDAWAAPFCNSLSTPAHYLMAPEPGADAPQAIRPLHALSGGKYAREGRVLIGPVDSGQQGCIWHRLYAEAALADDSAIDLYLTASDLPIPPADPMESWARHRLLPHASPDTPPGTPTGAWLPQASEVPFAPPILSCEPRPDKAGLFTLLLQHSGQRVRRLTGRYLWIELRLSGNSQNSPELAALRLYTRRLSWRDAYLPGFYTETLSGTAATTAGPATPQDFLERTLGAYEGTLTELEGRIAGAWQLTDPSTAPDHALPWIGQWIGVEAERAEAPDRLRQRLIAAPYTVRLNGTLGGLLVALELATGGYVLTGAHLDPDAVPPAPGTLALASFGDLRTYALMLGRDVNGGCIFLAGGAVTSGEIVVVEGFRLRRTFATILGTDLIDSDDPLTLGLSTSGNSFVGDTLILGDTARDELLALFRPEIDAALSDTRAVQDFYTHLAWRVMILVRGVEDRSEMKRIAAIADAAVPAHVEAQTYRATTPLIVGAASLVGIDSYLSDEKPFEPVRLGNSFVGRGDYVAGRGGLDSRADGPVSPAPTAHASGPHEVWRGKDFSLSALGSRAAAGRRIGRHIWTWEKEN